MNLKDEQYFGTLKQWKQKMMKSGTYGDAVFLQLASLHLETDIIVIPAFRESAENKTLSYSVVRAKNRTRCFSVNSVRGDMDQNKVCRCDTIKEHSDNNFHLNLNQFHVSTKHREDHSNPD